MTRELTKVYRTLAAHNLCKASGHDEGLRQNEEWACPTCRADVVRLVDGPAAPEVTADDVEAMRVLAHGDIGYTRILAAVEYVAALKVPHA
jgi:hypothetical protein